MCDKANVCCNQLEAEALHNNEQLLNLKIRSKNIQWHEYVMPLKSRSRPVFLQRQFNFISNYREPIGDHNRRKVLVCHDMMGNYLEDRHYHSSKKYDDYRFYHWPGIDYFCYFSHNYVTIPPCGWINAAHKHGVAVLGTFITEGAKGSQLLHEVLESTEMVNNTVDALVRLCRHYHFDGWLINIECKVSPECVSNLLYFVDRLREIVEQEIDSGSVIWYDSVIEGGQLSWQNEINDKNVRFFKAANGALVNYSWNDRSLQVTRTVCEQEREPFENVFFGIDIFGRGQTAKFQSKQTLARIVKHRFSTGIFAPGWTYETLQQYGYNIKEPLGDDQANEAFLMRNEKFWWLLWEHLATHPYITMPFYSDFCLGSGKKTYVSGLPKTTNTATATAATTLLPSTSAAAEQTTAADNTEGRFFNLSRQSLQPSVPLHDLATRYYDDAFNGGSCLRILQYDSSFRIFSSDFKMLRGGLVFAYAYKLNPRDGEFDCILRFCTGNNSRDCYLFLGDYYDTVSLQRGRCYVSPFKPKYNELLSGPLECPQIPKDMAFKDFQANGWQVRYYVVEFDGAIQVKDIGCLYRKSAEAEDTAYLGAVYINEFDVNQHDFPADSNIALIQVYGGDLLN
ncbi:cytosolic endo-beta-N-acetylglucosaminidase [Lucilia sericata]|uniref:cytosolic endo-beta-N-acetylglucosaminidase n=1 Tax=Lucilia sericata TaxID=13632 RepID=UPI0018A8715A|nr:cytosolic endo-beta-N-acetylglucosaminidase [Lucilia sericata]